MGLKALYDPLIIASCFLKARSFELSKGKGMIKGKRMNETDWFIMRSCQLNFWVDLPFLKAWRMIRVFTTLFISLTTFLHSYIISATRIKRILAAFYYLSFFTIQFFYSVFRLYSCSLLLYFPKARFDRFIFHREAGRDGF
jgi:hypothetical protein